MQRKPERVRKVSGSREAVPVQGPSFYWFHCFYLSTQQLKLMHLTVLQERIWVPFYFLLVFKN